MNHLLLNTKLTLDFYPEASHSEFENLWAVRREALNILSTLNRREKRTPFIEDVTVPVELLPRYVVGLTKILRRHNLEFSIYGHAGVGNVHCEPFLDLSNEEHRKKIDAIASEVFNLAISLGGTLTGEHGDGFTRTPLIEQLYGKEVYQLFRKVKQLFDPKNILNPGKIIGEQNISIAHDLKINGTMNAKLSSQ